MSKFVFDQYVGEKRPIEFDFSNLVGDYEDISSATIDSVTTAGEGDLAVTGVAINSGGDKVGCYIAATAPIHARLTCNALTGSQSLVLTASVRCN